MFKFQIWRIIPLLLLISVAVFVTPALSDPILLPKIEDGSEPTIDGNMTTTADEWQDAVLFNTTVNLQDASVRVTSDSDNLYIAFNYTSPDFIPVNNTSYNSTDGLNLDAHDWMVIQFDNNLDEMELASSSSPDDIIVFNQDNSTAYDGYLNGNSTHLFFVDTINNGTKDGSYSFANETADLVYETSKPHSTADNKGGDIDLSVSIIQFRMLSFTNQTSNSTSFTSTEWFTLRINETGTGLALKTVSEITVFLNILDDEIGEFQALETTLEQYGLNTSTTIGNFTLSDDDLIIIVVTEGHEMESTEIDDLIAHMELGGRVILYLSPESPSSSILADAFGFELLSNSVLAEDAELNITATEMGNARYISGSNLVTDRVVDNMVFSSSAFNISSSLNSTITPFMLRQDFMMENIFTATNLAYDSNDDDLVDSDESFTDLSLGVSIDFLKGGRVSVFPSVSAISNEYLTTEENMFFLLRMLTWNARQIDTISIHSVGLDTHAVNQTEPIGITVNVTDGFGDIIPGLMVKAELLLANNPVETVFLNSSGSLYSGIVSSARSGSMVIKITAYLDGYGFAEGEKQELIIINVVSSFNDLSQLSWVMILLFIVSAGVAVYAYLKTKKE